MRSSARSVVVTSCLLLALVLSGVAAGSTQNAPAKKWVAVFCGSVATWEQAVKSSAGKLESTVSGLKHAGTLDLPKAKVKLVGFLAGLVGSTQVMVRKIKAVGAPNVTNGSKIQAGVLTAFGQVATAFEQGRKSAQALPTTSPTAFSKAAKALATTIQANANRAGAAVGTLSRYSTKPLNDAAKNEPACKKL